MIETIQKQQKIDIPYPVKRILAVLKEHGFEAYIVGGCVRDALLGRNPEDWDITTSALPEQVKELFSNTVDTGIQHGTVMVLMGGTGYEVTTYRIDGEYLDSRHPSEVTFTRSLEEDLKRRDFTINALAWDEDGLIDLFDGISDLEQGIIRCVGDPDARFNEDALRIMRAVRFSAQLGFTIEEQTRAMSSKYAPRLAMISMERIRVEWEKTLLSDHPGYVNLYASLGMAPFIVPDYYGKCFDNGTEAMLEIFRDCRASAVRGQETDSDTGQLTHGPEESNISQTGQRQEAQLWDLAWQYSGLKPREFYRRLLLAAFFHQLTPKETGKVLQSLKYDNRTRIAVVEILKYKDQSLSDDKTQTRRLLRQMGLETFLSVLEYQKALHGPAALARIQHLLQEILKDGDPWQISQLAVNGADLIAAGVPAGKKIGEFLEKILQKVIQSPTLNRKDILLDPEFLEQLETAEE